jgi:hypothetical protein
MKNLLIYAITLYILIYVYKETLFDYIKQSKTLR